MLTQIAVKKSYLTSEKPPHEPNAVDGLVIAWDRNVDKAQRRVRVAERNDGDVDVARLSDGLVVRLRVRHNQKPRLPERRLNLVGERTGGETPSNRGGT